MKSAKRSFAQCFKTNQKPNEMGFDLRGETAKQSEVFGEAKAKGGNEESGC